MSLVGAIARHPRLDGLRRIARGASGDARHNARITSPTERILVLRHRLHQWDYNNHFLDWLARERPEVHGRIERQRMPFRLGDVERYALFVPWLQDPLRERFPLAYRYASRIEAQFDRFAIPVVNPVAGLSAAIKSRALATIGATGIRTARAVRLRELESLHGLSEQLAPPFILRDNVLHTTSPLHLIERMEQLTRHDVGAMIDPLALEFIDTRGDDGRYRKYRYVMVGEQGVPRHLIASSHWTARADSRIRDDVARREEIEYLENDDPNHAALNEARQALGFDVVAFDYSYDRDGRLVVWEPNPFPVIGPRGKVAAPGRTNHTLTRVHRAYELLADYYVARAAGGAPQPATGSDHEARRTAAG